MHLQVLLWYRTKREYRQIDRGEESRGDRPGYTIPGQENYCRPAPRPSYLSSNFTHPQLTILSQPLHFARTQHISTLVYLHHPHSPPITPPLPILADPTADRATHLHHLFAANDYWSRLPGIAGPWMLLTYLLYFLASPRLASKGTTYLPQPALPGLLTSESKPQTPSSRSCHIESREPGGPIIAATDFVINQNKDSLLMASLV